MFLYWRQVQKFVRHGRPASQQIRNRHDKTFDAFDMTDESGAGT